VGFAFFTAYAGLFADEPAQGPGLLASIPGDSP
jgi:hypothetical protein